MKKQNESCPSKIHRDEPDDHLYKFTKISRPNGELNSPAITRQIPNFSG